MAKLPIQISDIKGLTPAIDVRASRDVTLLEARNVTFSAKGLRSDFGGAIIGSAEVIADVPSIAQSLNVQEETLYCTSNGVYTLRHDDAVFTQLLDLSDFPPQLNQLNLRWSAAYLSNGVYLCHPRIGLYRLVKGVMTRLTPENTPGIPRYPLAISESNGRLLILSDRFVSWSAPSNAERFIPELGGAGQQLLSDRVTGTPVAVAGFQMGFIVWTTKDCLISEYIGGDAVFRYRRSTTEQIPVNAWSILPMPDGSQVILTQQGLHRIVNGQEPETLTPLFNEFLRTYMSANPSLDLRLDHSLQQNRIYVSQRNEQAYYNRTFVLELGLDKWGSLDWPHYGLMIAETGRNPTTMVGLDGRARRFKEHMRFFEASPGVFTHTNSFAEIGYVTPGELPEVDTLFEIQEITVGHKSRPSHMNYEFIDYNAAADSTEDYNAAADATEDYSDALGPLNHIPHKISVAFELDGIYDDQVIEPSLAVEKPGLNLYTPLTSGFYHRLRFETVNPGDGFNIGFINATAYYYGQLV